MRKLVTAVLLLGANLVFAQDFDRIRVRHADRNGIPTFVTGDLGRLLGPGTPGMKAQAFLRSQQLLPMEGREDFEPKATLTDELGLTHVRLQQQVNGLPVVGAEYIVHSDREGRVIGMNGRFAPDRNLPRAPVVDAWSALDRAMSQAKIVDATWSDSPDLVYVVDEKGDTFLAWVATAAYVSEEGEEIDRVFASATSGDMVMRDPKIHRARNRRTYTANNGTSLPGTLVLQETSGSTSDSTLQAAHNFAGTTYDYYRQVHNRDSYNNAGATLVSTVHYSVNYNNAFWNGSQMVYGDGDGTTFSPLAKSFDVDAHELTHAVTDHSADLIYRNESGALNEATSDIMAAAADAWRRGIVDSAVWKIGEDVYTPGRAGDALRTMNDPAASGDYDYYPTRYTGTGDNGGVHSNSGIANLAFYLMTRGGAHPRGKTSVSVTPLNGTATTSINMAAKIWYRALTVYMTSSTNFEGARRATASAATDLYGAAANATVHQAWDAVGAPGSPGGGGCTSTSGSLSGTGSSFVTPYYQSTVSGAHTAKLTGPSTADFDLYLQKWNGSTWVSVASSESSTSTENISYSGTSGYYRWRVYSYSGSGSFTLCTTKP